MIGENQRAGGKKKHICRDEITQPCIKNKQLKSGRQRVFNGFFESFKMFLESSFLILLLPRSISDGFLASAIKAKEYVFYLYRVYASGTVIQQYHFTQICGIF